MSRLRRAALGADVGELGPRRVAPAADLVEGFLPLGELPLHARRRREHGPALGGGAARHDAAAIHEIAVERHHAIAADPELDRRLHGVDDERLAEDEAMIGA